MARKMGLRSSAERLVRVVLDMDARVTRARGVTEKRGIDAVHDVQRALGKEPACRLCGCTDAKACPGGCCWIGPNLCSSHGA